MAKTWKTIGRIAVIVFVSLVVGFNIYTWNAQSLVGNALPMPFGYGAAVVLTGSMEPSIMTDDVILVAAQESYEENDVVAFQAGNMVVVHRIVEIREDTYITRGDANNANDDPIPVTAIKGKVISAIPNVGRLVWAIKSPIGLIITVALAVLLVEGSYRQEKKEKDNQQEQLKAEIRKLMEELESDK